MDEFNEKLNQELDFIERQICKLHDSLLIPCGNVLQLRAWRPCTDIYETDKAVIVKVEAAGMHLNDFQIAFANSVLTIQGIRRDTEAKLSYHCLEIPYGEFQLRVLIPGSFVGEHADLTYENGYLYIELPKITKPGRKRREQ
ncbi:MULTISPECIES: Hsp20/alpha crystallin family protein [Legionella]|uniref:Heat shock protein n=1 Tax=Legionella maceachernii TaxID=466 RepID=A0A0W0W070_9GAMM|nr:Hsp20/alpha crystallin family protein [Legionella maceachernii]KTD25629.1 heat shock protein [Legionella maceachernii]SJZ57992.1 Hsp20/alpha crystallin family protein [Legionella maceachernii]SUP00669.1 Hsp20/alpha crystallin family [Legionella maceachernii]